MSTNVTPQRNRLLAALPIDVQERLFDHLELTSLSPGKLLYASGDVQSHAWFPTDSIVSLQQITEQGASSEIVVVGNEGLVGTSFFMGGASHPWQAVVQSAGTAYRLAGHRLVEEFNRHGALLKLMLRYMQSQITQMAQLVLCNRHHSVDQQLCRWLLLSLDRLPCCEVKMTQERIGSMLGVRRETVTQAATKLQKEGVIEYRRGQITVLDRLKLEQLSCGCHAAIKEEADRLLHCQHHTPAAHLNLRAISGINDQAFCSRGNPRRQPLMLCANANA